MEVVLKARVRNGRLVLDEPTTLPEGQEVELVMRDDAELTAEERAELDRALDEGIDDFENGRTVDGFEFLAQLRASNEARIQQARARRDREGE